MVTEFLSNLILLLDERPTYKLITSPRQAISLLKEREHFFSRLDRHFADNLYHTTLAGNEADQEPNYFDLNKICQIFNDTERFSESSVIVVDYDMPEMNGIELCRQLKNHPIKKIMLTGVADYHTAVQAFNEGIIDKFIIKSTELMTEELNAAIRELQWKYFQALTFKISNSLPLATVTCLSDPAISEFLRKYFYQSNAAEMYLVDYASNFVMVDFKGNISWITIVTDESIDAYCEIAIDHEAPGDIINDLKTRRKIPLFFNEADRKLPVSEWFKYLCPVNILPDKNGVYYATAKGKSAHNLTTDYFFPHRCFLAQN